MERHRQGWTVPCAIVAAALIVAAGCRREQTRAATRDAPGPAATTPGESSLRPAADVSGVSEGPAGSAAPAEPGVSEDPAAPAEPKTPEGPKQPEKPTPRRRHHRHRERGYEPLLGSAPTEVALNGGYRVSNKG